jgi:hypothetical protein
MGEVTMPCLFDTAVDMEFLPDYYGPIALCAKMQLLSLADHIIRYAEIFRVRNTYMLQ